MMMMMQLTIAINPTLYASLLLFSILFSILRFFFFLFCSVKRRRNNHFGAKRDHTLIYQVRMNIFQNLMERLRQLVGPKGWDYCVLWKLSDDQRFIEWVDCCCAGTESIESDGELQFPVTPLLPCRDITFQHPKTKSCELLAQLPSCMSLDSGCHAQALISNQPKWLNFSNNSDSNVLEELVGTRILIPVAEGLIELFVAKQVCEDQNVMDYIVALCNISLDQGAMMNSSCSMDTHFTVLNIPTLNELQSKPQSGTENDQKDGSDQFQQPLATTVETVNLPYDISIDRIRSSDYLQQYNYLSGDKTNIDVCVEGSHDVFLADKVVMNAYKPSGDNGIQELMDPLNSMVTNNESIVIQGNEKESLKHENGRSDSLSDCSEQNDDEDDARYQRRGGSKGQSKNLVAERKRRKKLNERLYALRSLVPKISKLDRASILGDAIEFVKELENQVKELQDELEEHSDNDNGAKKTGMNGINRNVQSDIFSQNDQIPVDSNLEHDKGPNGIHVGANGNVSKPNQDAEITTNKTQQMEVQVEVAQIDGNQFFVKVFSEHKPGGFVRLMEALDLLGLEVTNANVNSFRGLVSNVFKVEKKGSEMVQADHVRDSLLELSRNPSKGLSEMAKASENNNGIECNYHNQQQQQQLQHHLHNPRSSSHHHHHHHHHLHHFPKQFA